MSESIDVQRPSDVEGGMQADRDVSADIRERASHEKLAPSPIGAWLGEAMSGHALNLAVAAFTGYALATQIHRRPARSAPARSTPAAPSRPRRVPEAPAQTSYRGATPNQDSRSSIRYR